uniref:T-cell activation inhibitor, mitochondrial n=1 Tax=Octopus bimaculoides TaxID=37653 RepID=A0A0L8HZG0_OCTBM|eukprot:XP_014768086.1 PREDICTED: T-cell activation inhibitor, mitochondrial-like isoform X1 [Octopus bimaculoides]
MFTKMLRVLSSKKHLCYHLCSKVKRNMNTSEVAAALRPFYFAVHPDMFGQYPKERSTNEDSLKKLNEYVSSLHTLGYARPTKVKFYLKITDDNEGSPVFKEIHISLLSRDLKTTVKTILKTCNLPLDYVDHVANQSKINTNSPVYKPLDTSIVMKPNPQISLQMWLEKNSQEIQRLSLATLAIQDEIDRLSLVLKEKLKLRELRWDSAWGNIHFRACLKSFDRLYAENTIKFESILKDRILVFASSTGVNLHGEIIISTEHVPTFWLSLFNNVRAYDPVLARLPHMEKELSQLMNNIQIVRRQRKHTTLMAEQYEELLNKLINSLRKCQLEASLYFLKEDLSDFELVLECQSGPFAVSPTGQFLIPGSCPGSLVIEFINKNKALAKQLLAQALRLLEMERIAHAKCLKEFNFSTLKKDDTISHYQMVNFCTRLLEKKDNLNILKSMNNLHIQVSHYYSVMQDGRICIPWDWTL